jgi:hypothetical protein
MNTQLVFLSLFLSFFEWIDSIAASLINRRLQLLVESVEDYLAAKTIHEVEEREKYLFSIQKANPHQLDT